MENKKDSEKEINKKLKIENKRLGRELKRSQAALAEMAALYTLKKKAEELWGAKRKIDLYGSKEVCCGINNSSY
ncbi:hypothetical protein [Thiospirochaeta perfilievii]|uniref:hypothetical protein n=1 Tax=Thiospirochaeta perfilievii TaxID=252967 RepID=UPI001659F096|nr:hypothetical protein [Thiospirochaeta perfilievii]